MHFRKGEGPFHEALGPNDKEKNHQQCLFHLYPERLPGSLPELI